MLTWGGCVFRCDDLLELRIDFGEKTDLFDFAAIVVSTVSGRSLDRI